jgi:hypothetical protein
MQRSATPGLPASAPEQSADHPHEEHDHETQMWSLQQYICELLIRNQQLRFELQETRSRLDSHSGSSAPTGACSHWEGPEGLSK